MKKTTFADGTYIVQKDGDAYYDRNDPLWEKEEPVTCPVCGALEAKESINRRHILYFECGRREGEEPDKSWKILEDCPMESGER